MNKRYWLMKSEPSCFSIDDLAQAPKQQTAWDGVRNYQARNWMRDAMQLGDLIFFYHSNCEIPGIVGIAEVVRTAYPDHTAFDPNSEHPDLSSTPEKPRWFMVDIQWVKKFSAVIPLSALKSYPALANMPLVKKGNRLSVMPVSHEEWQYILEHCVRA
jgi:predicted RNA-binding protein with PUA-like domain